ncbi:MAG: hypothetical protein RML10_10720 [Geminocystis sp.]|nr:hypothetical protein [Geminocystis sp.]
MKRICIDLDGCIAKLRQAGQTYADVEPVENAIEKLKALKEKGYYIIIYTARHMKTTNGNPNLAITKIGLDTLEWLKRHNIPYDEICFGKPWADVYIDDNAVRFYGWEYIDIDNLPESAESRAKNHFTFVIPMAGLSRRFFEKGYKVPKYMIDIRGKSMFRYAIESLPLELADKLIFAILKEHDSLYRVKQFIDEELEKMSVDKYKVNIFTIDKRTRGQAETVYMCKQFISDDDYLLIYNIDTHFKSKNLKMDLLDYTYDGILGAFFINEKDEKWSFAKVKSNGEVIEVAEKKQISCIALTGLYTFKRAKDFFEVVERKIAEYKPGDPELYIAPIYNELINRGNKYRISLVDEFIPLGTPEELQNFLENK